MDDQPIKKCSQCGGEFPATKEYFQWRSRSGVRNPCRICDRKNQHKHRQENIEAVRQYDRERYYRDLEHNRAIRRLSYYRFRAQRIAKSSARYHEMKGQITEQRKEYYERTKQATLDKNCEYRRRNRERIAAKRKEYASGKGREVIRAIHRNRKARKRNAPGSHTAADVQRIYDAQKGYCYYCGVEVGDLYHVDHVIPLVRGGSNAPDNLVIACPVCNLSKHNKLPHEWPEGGRLL